MGSLSHVIILICFTGIYFKTAWSAQSKEENWENEPQQNFNQQDTNGERSNHDRNEHSKHKHRHIHFRKKHSGNGSKHHHHKEYSEHGPQRIYFQKSITGSSNYSWNEYSENKPQHIYFRKNITGGGPNPNRNEYSENKPEQIYFWKNITGGGANHDLNGYLENEPGELYFWKNIIGGGLNNEWNEYSGNKPEQNNLQKNNTGEGSNDDQMDPLGFNEVGDEFVKVFVQNILKNPLFGKGADTDFIEVTFALEGAINMLRKAHNAPPEQKRILMMAFAATLAELIVIESRDTLPVILKVEIVINALETAFLQTTGTINYSLISEVSYLVIIFLEETPQNPQVDINNKFPEFPGLLFLPEIFKPRCTFDSRLIFYILGFPSHFSCECFNEQSKLRWEYFWHYWLYTYYWPDGPDNEHNKDNTKTSPDIIIPTSGEKNKSCRT